MKKEEDFGASCRKSIGLCLRRTLLLNNNIEQMENLYTENCIRTVSGIYINVFDPTPEMICIEDIAHALSFIPRWGGHTSEFLSVATHSLNCMHLMEDEGLRLQTLLHDASEAYLMDIPSPIKKGLTNYKEIEDKLMSVIAAKFGFQYPLHEKVKEVDRWMLELEWNCLVLKKQAWTLRTIPPQQTRLEFLSNFRHYVEYDFRQQIVKNGDWVS